MRRFYQCFDEVVLFLWTWLGVRRRWLFSASMTLCIPWHLRSLTSACVLALLGLFCILAYIEEATESATVSNASALSRRSGVFSTIIICGEAFFFVADCLSHRWLSALDDIGFVLFMGFVGALVPTTPRKKIEMPQFFAKEATA